MKNTITALLALSILAGCDASAEQPEAKSGETRNCTTTGPNSPIVTGEKAW